MDLISYLGYFYPLEIELRRVCDDLCDLYISFERNMVSGFTTLFVVYVNNAY